ncbi:MAG: hypothetical protein QCI82_06200 [Candidatus Thermoplasmatota archaeon]|nr:hypothetical protein [Candidatus Thermoplasmatota archaeon]
MPEEEENPFLLKKVEKKPEDVKVEEFGSSEEISFMVSPDEKRPAERTFEDTLVSTGPHWEDAGKPVWDRGVNTFDIVTEEIIDHDKRKEEDI